MGDLLGHPAFGSLTGFAQRALHQGPQPRQPRLQNVVGRPDFERFDRYFFAERAGNKDERQIGAFTLRKLQCGKTVERRKLVIRENQVDSTVLESGQELGAGLDAGCFADEMICFKESLNKRRVSGVTLELADLQAEG